MKKNHSTVILFSITAAFLLSCRGNTRRMDDESSRVYQDSQNLFEIAVPSGLIKKEFTDGDIRIVEHSSQDEEGVAHYIIRVRILKGSQDLFNSGYEAAFLSMCKCSILERGIVNFAGKPARYYMISLRNGEWVGIQRHLALPDNILILSVTGPKDKVNDLRVLFNEIVSSFRLTH